MRYRMALPLFLLLYCMAVPAFGASREAPAFLRAVIDAPLEGDDALRVHIQPDEPLCRKAYGKEWASRCAASPGRDGAPVTGVKLEPDVPGDWRWEADGRTFAFRPRQAWQRKCSFRHHYHL